MEPKKEISVHENNNQQAENSIIKTTLQKSKRKIWPFSLIGAITEIDNPVEDDETLENPSYEENEPDELINIWEKTVEMADATTEKRINASNIYMSIETALIAVLYFVSDWWNYVVAGIGIIVACFWYLSVQNYRYLSSAKWAVVNELEKHLPYKPFTYEWKLLTHRTKKRYLQVTKLERFMPILFGILYFLFILFMLIFGLPIK